MNARVRNLLLAFAVGVVVVGWATVQVWWGRYQYTGDAIAYLDVARALGHGDWALAFSPYWSVGYPAVLELARAPFSDDPQDEWVAIQAADLVVFVLAYLSYLAFLKAAVLFTAKVNGTAGAGDGRDLLLVIGSAIFWLWEVQSKSVCRISPDLLVSAIVFLVTAASLHYILRPTARTAAAMGALIGLGYLVKAAFPPIAAALLLTVLAANFVRWRTERPSALASLLWAPAVAFLIAAPYVLAISSATGHFTLGESGALNYAWSVNGLPSYEHWQGGPPELGAPIHPARLVLQNPPVFVFPEPFHVTYPPWFNPPYWYQGYRHVFRLSNQLTALRDNLRTFLTFFVGSNKMPLKIGGCIAGLLALSFVLIKDWRAWIIRLRALWPLWVPSIAGIGLYLVVVIEPRYVVAFLIILFTAPFLALFFPTPLIGRKAGVGVAAFVVIGSAALIGIEQSDVITYAIDRDSYLSEEQWRLGLYLARTTTHPGEKVASVQVGHHSDNGHRTWAYVSRVHIVAEIGNDAYDLADQHKDFDLFVGDAEVQQKVFAEFRQAGADLVIVRDVPGPLQGSGWISIPATRCWMHRL